MVVTDVVMPRMGGPELIKTLRNTRDGFGVIFMSGYTEEAALENSSIANESMVLNKPFSSELLAHKVNEIMERVKPNGKAKAVSTSG